MLGHKRKRVINHVVNELCHQMKIISKKFVDIFGSLIVF